MAVFDARFRAKCGYFRCAFTLETLVHKPGALAGATALENARRRQGHFSPTHEEFWSRARRHLGDAAGTRVLIEVDENHGNSPEPIIEIPHPVRATVGH
ncbi:MAG: hypothetical protein ACYC1I_11420 [Acidimicrobiales bacterium]